MKFILVVAVVLIGFFIWRSSREGRVPPPRRPPKDDTRAIEMVSCAVCGLHCPKNDALTGKRGVYCTAKHRDQAEP